MLSIVTVTGLLHFARLDEENEPIRFERKDVWDMRWADDNPNLFAIMEKTRMYIFKNFEPEDPISSAGYLCSFKQLEVRAALMDEILREPENPSSDLLLDLEVKALRDTRELLRSGGTKEALKFIEENSHPRLWRLLAESATENLEFSIAEASYVRCKDFAGIQFIKRLQNIQSPTIQRAEVAAWFDKFSESESLFLENDRGDLAIGLRKTLGDWFKVLQLLKSGSTGNDEELREAWTFIGHFFADRNKWEEAVQYFEKSQSTQNLVASYFNLEDFHSLEALVETAQSDESLKDLGEKFATFGMGRQAVESFIKVCARALYKQERRPMQSPHSYDCTIDVIIVGFSISSGHDLWVKS